MAGWPSTYASYGYPTQGYQDPTAAYYAQYGYSYPGYGQGYQQGGYYAQPQQQQPPVQAPQPSYNTMPTAPVQEPPADNYGPPPQQQYEPPPAEAPAKKRTWLGRIWSFAWRAAVLAGAFVAGQWTANGSTNQPGPNDPTVRLDVSSLVSKVNVDPADASKVDTPTSVFVVEGAGDDTFAIEMEKDATGAATGKAKLVDPALLAPFHQKGLVRADIKPTTTEQSDLLAKLVATYKKLTTPTPDPTI
jgi:hypothetical protein